MGWTCKPRISFGHTYNQRVKIYSLIIWCPKTTYSYVEMLFQLPTWPNKKWSNVGIGVQLLEKAIIGVVGTSFIFSCTSIHMYEQNRQIKTLHEAGGGRWRWNVITYWAYNSWVAPGNIASVIISGRGTSYNKNLLQRAGCVRFLYRMSNEHWSFNIKTNTHSTGAISHLLNKSGWLLKAKTQVKWGL